MLAYAANTPQAAGRDRSPKALMLILAGHAAVIAAVLAAKPEIMDRVIPTRTILIDVPVPPPPPPPDQNVDRRPQQPVTQDRFIPQERPIIDMEQPTTFQIDTGPTIADIGAVIGSGPTTVIDRPKAEPVRLAARLATPNSAIKPPYPLDKRRAEEEARLRLKLSIDAHGRVISVEPIGAADPSFLEAARRHIIRAWRYKPATEDGVAIPSSTVISLSFRLEDV